MSGYKIVETDNYNGDYPDEKFVNIPPLPKEAAEVIREVINTFCCGPDAKRYWKVEESTYVLQPEFEP